jgi:hypothetical protein
MASLREKKNTARVGYLMLIILNDAIDVNELVICFEK